jgi:FkbM family methyltransferase
MSDLADAARHAAATIEHPWDQRAIEWPLTQESVVIDVGGYIGRWALQIVERYHPRLYVFEPQPWAADVCRDVLGDNATVLPFGLGAESGSMPMGRYETDGCSFLREDAPVVTCPIREIGETLQKIGISTIDLMMMNIEGYEYILLPHMLDQGILPQRLMVQFHPFDAYVAQTGPLQQRMEQAGYRASWAYGLILIAWEKDTMPAQPARRKPGRRPKT